MSQPSQPIDRAEVRKRVLELLRDLTSRHPTKWQWEWSAQIRPLFEACGLSKCEVDFDTRASFKKDVRQLLPMNAYTPELAAERVDHLIDIVVRYHAIASAIAAQPDSV